MNHSRAASYREFKRRTHSILEEKFKAMPRHTMPHQDVRRKLKTSVFGCNRRYLSAFGVAIGLTLPAMLSGCGGGSAGLSPNTPTAVSYDFNAGRQGWTADYADAPSNVPPSALQLDYAHANLPQPLDTSKKALKLTSHNTSDDLWYFLKRQVTGLAANTSYRVRFDVEIATNAPAEHFGVGGGPGLSVTLKAGASPQEPKVEARDGTRVFNLDKGNQVPGGKDAVVLGNISIPGDQAVYRLKPLDNAGQPFSVRTDSSGRAWVFVGTDSGFEGVQTLYYTKIKLTFSPG